MVAINQLRQTFNDYDGTPQTASIGVIDEGTDIVTWKGLMQDFVGAVGTYLIGRTQNRQFILEDVDNGPGKATSPLAQKGLQLILEIKDSVTGGIYRERYPMPYMAKAAEGGFDAWVATGQGNQSLTVANTLHPDWTTLKDAYDAIGISPLGNAATLERAYIER